jgi:hypothetical protein
LQQEIETKITLEKTYGAIKNGHYSRDTEITSEKTDGTIKNGHYSRDTGNIRYIRDKGEGKKKTTQHRKLKRRVTRTPPKTEGIYISNDSG